MNASQGRRRIAASALAILAAAAFLAALAGGYSLRAIADSEQFAERATAALDDEDVRAEIAKRTAERLVAAKPDLVAVQPVIEGVVSGIAGQSAFQGLFRSAVRDLHRAVFEQDVNTLTLTLVDIGTTIRGTLAAVQPKLAKEIPAGSDTTVLDADPPAALLGLVRLTEAVKWLPLLFLLIGLAAAFSAARIAADSRRAVVTLGVSIALGAALALVGLRAAKAIVLTAVDDQGARDAVSAIWDAYLSDLGTALILFAACGAVLAAAASSMLRPVDVGAQVARGWAAVSTVPERPRMRFVRALLLIVVGAAIIVARDEFVELVAILIGLYVAYAGVAELMRLTISDSEFAAADRRRGRATLVAAAIGAVAIVVAGVALIGVGGISATSLAIVSEGCNGSKQLCDRPLDEVAFASTHNSMSAATNPGWLFAQQEKGLPDQLRDGIHGLLIDAHYGIETEDGTVKTDFSGKTEGERKALEDEVGTDTLDAALRIRDRIVNSETVGEREIYLCHGFCEPGAIRASAAFKQIRDFLAANPSEVLVIVIEDYVKPTEIAALVESSGLRAYVYDGPVGPPWPTLQEMIDSGGRILMLAENDDGGNAIPWYHLAYGSLVQETPFSFERPAQLTDPDLLAASCEPNRGPARASLFLINHWIDTSPAPRPSNAAKVNTPEALRARVAECEARRGLLPGLIAVDFYLQGDVFAVVDELNAESPQAP